MEQDKRRGTMKRSKCLKTALIRAILIGCLTGFVTGGVKVSAQSVTDNMEEYSSDLENQTIRIAEVLGKTVVSISTQITKKIDYQMFSQDELMKKFFEEFFGEIPEGEIKKRGLGSGVIIDEEGFILTNEHVVANADKIKIKLYDGREFDAEVRGTDVRSDLAVIKIDAEDLPVAELGNAADLKIGQWVMAIGNPLGYVIEGAEPTVTVGVVSALRRNLPVVGKRDRSYTSLIQTDAAINPGNSGGPLVDLNGKIVGINVSILTTTGGFQGLGFAISAERVKQVLDRLMAGREVLYGWLGISVQNPGKDLREYLELELGEGVIVMQVFEDSPAEKAGIEVGDVILTFNGETVEDSIDLVEKVSANEPGEKVKLGIKRDRGRMTITAELGKRPSDLMSLAKGMPSREKARFRGMKVQDITTVMRKKYDLREDEGVVVTDVEKDSPADRAGIRVSDVITHVGRRPVNSKEEFLEAVEAIRGPCLVRTPRGFFVIKAE
ncbi:MAG: PDZ domain-containing protein [Candidatus Omnitrophica bacterium]|nr:PDZ domain-containing protein [Candidatus Omnitrophota bacterium]